MEDRSSFTFRQAVSLDQDAFAAFRTLTEAVFGIPPLPPWPAWGLYDAAGRCVAGLQCALLEVALDGIVTPVAALRNVAVAADRRGQGLMRELFAGALPWCDAHAALALLYTAVPELYEPFGFAAVPQHAFRGDAPSAEGAASARPFDRARDAAALARLLRARAPVSSLFGMVQDEGLAAARLPGGRWALSFDETLDAFVVHRDDGDVLEIADVVTSAMPSLARILGALGRHPPQVRCLFAPDLLAWDAEPVEDDTGLMARGLLPPAMLQPFRIPPTAEF